MPAALLLASEGGFTVTGAKVIASFDLFGITWNLTETVFIQWIVMLVLLIVMLILKKFLFKPVNAVLEQRQAEIGGM